MALVRVCIKDGPIIICWNTAVLVQKKCIIHPTLILSDMINALLIS
jgi:hypothetical protein